MSAIDKSATLVAMYPIQSVILATLLAWAGISRMFHTSWRRRNPKNLPLPPGPKGYPIIGSLFDYPYERPWVTYDKWLQKYGDMVYFEVLGQSILVLGSLKRTNDLFDKRSSNYSDRPRMPMFIELMETDHNMAFLPYGQWWRRHRRLFNEHFHHNAVVNYLPIQLREARALLYRLLVSPEGFIDHIMHSFGATIMGVAYGITVKEVGDPYLENGRKALRGLAEAGIPGSFLVDRIPALKYVPSWFPGAEFKRKAAAWRKANHDLSGLPFKRVEQDMENGTAVPSVLASLIEGLPEKNDPNYADEKKIAENVAAVAYVGGADTTSSTLQAFFLAMALHPEVQKKAQAELDSVIGNKRLPDFEDRSSLPYINAIVKESMRWNQVTPLAVGHMCSEDDEYDGYFIPRGTLVFGNAWTILHDPEVFSDPFEYNPDRYLKDGKLDPNARNPDCAAFGFGRRICPGRHMSDNGLYSLVSSVLSVYKISPPLDDFGQPIKQTPEFTSGLLSYPVSFKCIIKPRGPTAEALIRECSELDH